MTIFAFKFGLESQGFNPCFNGFVVMTYSGMADDANYYCFNPCFNGFVVMTL